MNSFEREQIAKLGLVVDKGLEWKDKYEAATAERDTLRAEMAEAKQAGFAEVDWWSKRCAAATARATAAEAHAETLRKALEQIGGPVPPNGWACLWCGDGSAEDDCAEDCPRAIAILALATTPAMSLAAVQAEAIEEKEAENGR